MAYLYYVSSLFYIYLVIDFYKYIFSNFSHWGFTHNHLCWFVALLRMMFLESTLLRG